MTIVGLNVAVFALIVWATRKHTKKVTRSVKTIKRVNRSYLRDYKGRFAKRQIVWVSDLRRYA